MESKVNMKLMIFTLGLVCLSSANPQLQGERHFSDQFRRYIATHQYSASVYGIVQGGKLKYGASFGSRYNTQVEMSSEIPMEDLSKVLTAIAIHQLAEDNFLDLNDYVFGTAGLLWFINPHTDHTMASGITNITVKHLLQNSAGWDQAELLANSSRLDVMSHKIGLKLNNPQQLTGQDVVSQQQAIIRSLISKPLSFQPGSRSVPLCSLCFMVLGQIIEVTSGQAYKAYIHRNILQPAGMWRTQVGPSEAQQHVLRRAMEQQSSIEPERLQLQDISYYTTGYQLAEASSGWFTTLYDASRLVICLFEGERCDKPLLQRETMQTILGRLDTNTQTHDPNENHRLALGMRVKADGSTVLESSNWATKYSVFIHTTKLTATRHEINRTVLFFGYSQRHHRHIGHLKRLQGSSSSTNFLNNELQGNELIHTENSNTITHLHLNGSAMIMFVNMMRIAEYFPAWIHSYTVSDSQNFIVIFKKTLHAAGLKFRLIMGESKLELLHAISKDAREGYQVTYVQSLAVTSTASNSRVLHLVKMDLPSGETDQVQFDISRSLEGYYMDMQLAISDGFFPAVQSLYYDTSERVSYVLRKTSGGGDAPIAVHDYTLQEFVNSTRQMFDRNYMLAYVDTYSVDMQLRFSVVYERTQGSQERKLETSLTDENVLTTIQSWATAGYSLHLMAAYETPGGTNFFGVWIRSS